MLYDSNNPVDANRARRKLNELIEKGSVFELTEKKTKRSTRQNSYLHLILGYFAIETGNTIDYVKENYFKRLCNSELFVIEREDKFIGHVTCCRSSKDLDTREMALAIDRFRNWSSASGGIYLPEANEDKFLQYIEIELQRHKEYL